MRINKIFFAILLPFMFLMNGFLFSQEVPKLIQYQGNLTDENGNFVDGTVNLIFSIYSAPSGGSALWSEQQNQIQVTKGLFSVLLGSITPISESVFSQKDRYLEITVNDKKLSPRQRIASVAYSLVAQTVPDNTIESRHIKDATIKGSDIANSTISQDKLSFTPFKPRYSSSWTSDNNSTSHQKTFTHNLNLNLSTESIIVAIYFSPTNPPSEIYPVYWRWDGNAGNPVCISISSNSIILNISPSAPLHGVWTPATSWRNYNSGYWKVIIW